MGTAFLDNPPGSIAGGYGNLALHEHDGLERLQLAESRLCN